MKPKNHMVLTTFMLPAGYHKDSWRMEGSRAEELGNLDFVADLTAMAEAAKLDAVFFGDIVHANTVMRGDIKMNGFYEPMTVLAALAARTKNIGLIGTMSTSFSRALQPGPAAVRTGPHVQRPGRLEHRDVVGRLQQLRRGGRSRSRRAVPAGHRVRGRGAAAVGQLVR